MILIQARIIKRLSDHWVSGRLGTGSSASQSLPRMLPAKGGMMPWRIPQYVDRHMQCHQKGTSPRASHGDAAGCTQPPVCGALAQNSWPESDAQKHTNQKVGRFLRQLTLQNENVV